MIACHLWEPGTPCPYSLVAVLRGPGNVVVDEYVLRVGVGTINVKEFSFRGCGQHEDADVRGQGADVAMHVNGGNLLRWIGADAFLASSYPLRRGGAGPGR